MPAWSTRDGDTSLIRFRERVGHLRSQQEASLSQREAERLVLQEMERVLLRMKEEI